MDWNQRLSKLSPEQRELLQQKLKEKQIDIYRLSIHSQDRKRRQFPLSFGQERLWFIHQLAPDMFAYNIIRATQLEGNLNRAVLERSIDEIVKRHEILRTAFAFDNKKPVQEISPEISVLVEFVDLTGISPERQTGKVKEIVREETRSPFDLSRAPLLRTKLLKLHTDVHLFLFVIHHIVSDALSVQIFIRELLQLYKAFCQNRSSPLPELSIQYVDYACWQRQWFGEDGIGLGLRKTQEAFWLGQFSGEVPVLTLPTDYPRPAMLSFGGERLAFHMEFQEISKLKQFALKEECSFYIIVLALFNVLLSKLSGMEAIVVGTPVNGRRHAAVQNLIGMFVNMLPLINFPYPDKTFREFLKEVRNRTLMAFENQEYPYGDIIEKININRNPGRNPLFDVVFNLTTGSSELFESTIAGLRFKSLENYFQTAKFDLTLDVFDENDRLNFDFEYCTKLFKRDTVERFIGCYKELIRSVLLDMDQKIGTIDWIPANEKRRLLHGFNKSTASYPQDQTLHRLFEEQVGKNPDRIALRAPGRPPSRQRTIQQLTYRTLDDMSCRMATLLSDRGVRPGSLVALMLEPSSEMAAAIIGTLKAGGAYLPIDPLFPAERVNFILSDSQAEIVLGTPAARAQAGEKVKGKPVDPSSTAYVIYTSGTTGRPKGVLIEHRNVVSLLFNDRFQFDFTEKDVWTLFHSYCFDFSVWEMYGAWLYGGELVLVSKMTARDTGQFFEMLKENRVTVLNQTPSAFYNLVNLEAHEEQRSLNIRVVIFGGEALHPARLKEWYARYPETKLINMYGITETTVHVTFKEIENQDLEAGISNIGKPIPSLRAYVVDRQLNLLPCRVAGELVVGGEGVGRGYLNRPELTAERFVENPYRKGERLYRSGDLVRFCPQEELEYLGRIDLQVKIRGFRIELREIETQLVKHHQVEDGVVIDRQGKDKNSYLAAYYVPLPAAKSDSKRFISTLRDYLSQQLPDYMIPAYFVPLDKIPLTANGKVDRKALPEPELELTLEDYVPPRNHKEELLTAVWQEVLGIPGVGVTDHFFAIGGDSIKAIQVSSRLKNYGLDLKTSDLFLHPTIENLAEHVQNLGRKIDQRIVEGEVELTASQQWFFQYGSSHKHLFCQSVLLHQQERFSEEILEKVLKKMVEHHDALRMVYKFIDDHVIQVNRAAEGKLFDFEVFDFGETGEVAAIILKESHRIQEGIDLETGPLLKVALFKTATGDYLLIIIHQLVVDEVSWRILLKDLAASYRQLAGGEDIKFPAKTDSFQCWAGALKQYAERGDEDEEGSILNELEYWRLVDMTPLERLPVDCEIGADRRESKYSEVLWIELDRKQTGILKEKVNWAYHTETGDILLTALGLAVREWTGAEKVGVHLEGNARESIIDDIDVSRTVGWFSSQYPVVLDTSGIKDLSHVIKNVKETLRRVPHHGTGYGILKYLTPDEKKGGYRFTLEPKIRFNFLGGCDELTNMAADTMVGQDAHPGSESPYALEVNGTVQHGQLRLSFTYNTFEFKKESMEQLVGYYRSNLLRLIDHCCSRREQDLTPSDLGYSAINLEELEEIENDLSDIDE
jgi:amino acid adenylation domain-containing protein/non-ribosomal peptide synthase protein (TIGR01720 family)